MRGVAPHVDWTLLKFPRWFIIFLFQHVVELGHSWIDGRPSSEGHLGNVVNVYVDGNLKDLSPGQRR